MSMDIDVALYDQEMAAAEDVLDTAVESFRMARDCGAAETDNVMGLFFAFQDMYPAEVLASVLVAAVRRLA